MSNRYLFRGKRVDNDDSIDRYIIGQLYMSNGRAWITDSVNVNLDTHYLAWFEVIPKTVGQFTGRQDDKKVLIFGGDKVVFAYGKDKILNHPNMIRKGIVVFENYQWSVKVENSVVRVPFSIIDGIEVIKSIHD